MARALRLTICADVSLWTRLRSDRSESIISGPPPANVLPIGYSVAVTQTSAFRRRHVIA
jgi:hypothetical protein